MCLFTLLPRAFRLRSLGGLFSGYPLDNFGLLISNLLDSLLSTMSLRDDRSVASFLLKRLGSCGGSYAAWAWG